MYDTEWQGSSHDTNQIAAAAAACQLLFTERRGAPESSHHSPELLPELDLLSDLTQQIKGLKLRESSSKDNAIVKEGARSESERVELATLYCQRAQQILERVNYDASARLSLALLDNSTSTDRRSSSDGPEMHEDEEGERTFRGVEQALKDALAAIASAPTSGTGHFLAAQCRRCLGHTVHAVEHAALALQFAPQEETSDIQRLAKELAVDATELPMRSYAPSLVTPTHFVAVFEVANQRDDVEVEQQQQEEEQEDAFERHRMRFDSSDDSECFHRVLRAGHERLAAIAASLSLATLETMMHENVHHECATRAQTHDVETAFNDAASFLWTLLGHSTTRTALGLTDPYNGQASDVVREMLAIATSGADSNSRLLVENRTLRQWLVQTLAPAARRFPTQLGRTPVSTTLALLAECHARSAVPDGQRQQLQEAVLAMFVRDTLVVLTRLLLALAGWRRCTSMPHALLYAELCADFAKEVGVVSQTNDASGDSVAGLSQRFDLLCSDAYGRALLELASEPQDALQIYQASFQAALVTGDASYELRAHHSIGQAYARSRELELAHATFADLLDRSRAVGDTTMACLAHYELGDCCAQRGNGQEAQTHFQQALTLCYQTAHGGGSWRRHSVRQAIAFYDAMRPTRRNAVRAAPATKQLGCQHHDRLVSTSPLQVPVRSDSAATDDSPTTKLRRPAIWIAPPRPLRAEHDSADARSLLQSADARSLLQTLLGEQTALGSAGDSKTGEAKEPSRGEEQRNRTTTKKLFARTPPSCGRQKPRRMGAWRDAVFAVPPSYAELRMLAAVSSSPRASGGLDFKY